MTATDDLAALAAEIEDPRTQRPGMQRRRRWADRLRALAAPTPTTRKFADQVAGEVWAWLNRHDSPWSPSDGTVSSLAYAIAALPLPEDERARLIKAHQKQVRFADQNRERWLEAQAVIEKAQAVLADHAHADTCAAVLSPEAGYPCSCWKSDLSAALGDTGTTLEDR